MSLAKTNLHQYRKGQETVRSFFSCFFLHHSFGFILRSMQKQRLHQDRFPRDVGLRAAHLAAGQWGLHCSSCRLRIKKLRTFKSWRIHRRWWKRYPSCMSWVACYHSIKSFHIISYHIGFVWSVQSSTPGLFSFVTWKRTWLCQKGLALCVHMSSFRSYSIKSIFFAFTSHSCRNFLVNLCIYIYVCVCLCVCVFIHQGHYSLPKDSLND